MAVEGGSGIGRGGACDQAKGGRRQGRMMACRRAVGQ